MKRIFWLLALAASAALGSCTLDDGGPIDDGGNGESISLKLNVDGLSANVTRATAATPDEKMVHTLTLLFFERSNDGSGKYVDYCVLEEPKIGGVVNDITFRSGSPLRASLPYNILAVANLDKGGYLSHTYNPSAGSPPETAYASIGDWSAGFEGMTEGQAIVAATVGIAGNSIETDRAADNAVRINSSEILMGAAAVKAAEQEIVEMTLTRAVSRFDVVNNASGYDVVSASIWNANQYSRIWGDNVLVGVPVVERFYGVDAVPDPDGGYFDIMNTLYSFEHFVLGPRDTDDKTTCLIIGVQKSGTTDVTYHRINIAPKDQVSQSLRRNMVYQVTLRGVKGSGAALESGAYTGGNNELNYIINYWDLDDDEGIIRFDGKNVLAVPVSRIQFLSDAARREYNIFTFGDGTLAMATLNMSEGVTALLTGNTLTVSVTALPEGVERNGTLKFSFAGLEAQVDINQTEKLDTYLELSAHSLPAFPDAANAGLNNDANAIKVNASGTWTAELRNNEADPSGYKFSFRQNSYLGAIDSSDPAFADLIVNNTVRLYTSSANAADDPREAFALFKLKSDPTIAQAAILTQRGASDIYVTPSIAEVRFAASGDALTANTFTVHTDNLGGYFSEWNATVMNTSNGNNDWFRVNYTYDATVYGNNKVTVIASQSNFTGAAVTATLRLQVNGTSTYIDIPVVQETYSLTLNPASPAPAPVTKGESGEVTVTIPTGATWSATILSNRTVEGVDLVAGHQGYLVDGSGTQVTSLSGMQGTQKLKASFPKLLTPNVNITPEIEVRVFITGTNIADTITIRQSPLTPRQVHIQSYNDSYFSFGTPAYNTDAIPTPSIYTYSVWRNMINAANFSNSGNALLYIKATPSRATGYFNNNNIEANVSLLNINRVGTSGISINNNNKWNEADAWWQAEDGNVLIICTDSAVPTFLTSRGYTQGSLTDHLYNYHQINDNADDRATRLMQYILKDGPATIGTMLNNINDITLQLNSTRTEMSGWPATAVPILKYRQANATALIDLENQLIVFTEVDAFYAYFTGAAAYLPPTYGGPHYDKFLTNLVAVMLNMTQYGSHWTDHLTGKATGGYAALAPENIDFK